MEKEVVYDTVQTLSVFTRLIVQVLVQFTSPVPDQPWTSNFSFMLTMGQNYTIFWASLIQAKSSKPLTLKKLKNTRNKNP
jgi:hypothetical protein